MGPLLEQKKLVEVAAAPVAPVEGAQEEEEVVVTREVALVEETLAQPTIKHLLKQRLRQKMLC